MYSNRIENLLAALSDDVEYFISSHFPTVRYLTGFSGSNGGVLISHNQVLLFTDGRYLTQAQNEASYTDLKIARNVLAAAMAEVPNGATVGFEADHVSAVDYMEHFAVPTALPLSGIVENLRKIKDSIEVAAIKTACEITSEALENIFSRTLIGKTEIQIAAELEHEFLNLGAENRAFDSIVASGPNSAVPHHQPTNRQIQAGDFLKVDCGARFAGYHADLTRTVVIAEISQWQQEIFDAVAAAAALTRESAKVGVDVFDLDSIARKSIENSGFAEYFLHPTGHGVGLEIHELPFLGRKDGILRPQMTITVEPGIYLAGRGGVRIEDTILITESGHTNLTTANRELQIL